jgi:putative tryptophan/tyrosine transport system substrate-binding protein
VKRRDFITLLGGAAAAWPLAARGQQGERMRRVGWLVGWAENNSLGQASVAAFARGLERWGWVEGKNVRIDYRFAPSEPVVFKKYAAELVGLSPDVILASNSPAVEALKSLTRSIPIVFAAVADPVEQGFVQSLARPGGNITGFSGPDAQLGGKWLGLLKDVVPSVMRAAVMYNPDTAPYAGLYVDSAIEAAPNFGMTVTRAPVRDDMAIEEAIAALARQPGGGLVVLPEAFTDAHRETIAGTALRFRLPTIGLNERFPRAGGLMSYYIDTVEIHAQAATYVDRILKGANPADLPVQRPTKFPFTLNLATAKAIGLQVPPGILAIADEVIQ